jgi:hypothetical protein
MLEFLAVELEFLHLGVLDFLLVALELLLDQLRSACGDTAYSDSLTFH